jgi:hypothetical protein
VITEEQKQAKLEAYATLKGAGLEVPKELADEVDVWVADLNAQNEANAQAQQEAQVQQNKVLEQANQNGPWYVVNCYPAPFNFRLDRQTEKRRIELKSLGTPGDMHPLKEEDLQDPILRTNINLGLLEVIPAGEAQIRADNQTRNMGPRVHAPLSILRNSLNEPYAQGAVKVEAEFNSQGVTVATLDPQQMQGHVEDKRVQVARHTPGQPVPQATQTQQATSVVSGFIPTGGNPAIISQGGMQQDRIRQDIAQRARGQKEAPLHAGPGELIVTVNPVQKT